jgi:chorismate lyase/3-hydroxybenzoate synthase
MASNEVLKVEHCSAEQLANQSAEWWGGVLGVVSYGSGRESEAGPRQSQPAPFTSILMPVLNGLNPVYEVWCSHGAAVSGQHAHLHYRHNDDTLFGCISLHDTEFNDSAAQPQGQDCSELQVATEAAYRQIFELLDTSGYHHLVRVWNYLPGINAYTHSDERYRQFNRARQRAFIACGRPIAGNVPAASALGSAPGSPLAIYFIARRHAAVALENPRQTSAFNYPPQYGPASPTFSRASVAEAEAGSTLFISGTASIVGHETLHVGDVAAQTREALTNIQLLLDAANRDCQSTPFCMNDLHFKVYVRRAQDLPAIQSQLRSLQAHGARVLYLQADICRADLLVEIEASGSAASDPG